MEGLLVSAATGALKPVLEKLAALMGDEYKRFKGVRREVQYLTDELAAMHAFLLKMSEEESPDVQDKAWMKEVRELSYDMEDSLDEFMLRVDDKSANPDGFIDKCKNLLTKTKARRRIAKTIEVLKVQVKEVGDRNGRYQIRETISKTSNATVDRRALTIFEDASKLVGINRLRDELIELLMKDDGSIPAQKPKVLSIVGFGGLGKTTLANEVYQELKGKFKCHAFVSVSRSPDPMNVLRNILFQVSDEPYPNIEAWDIQLLISKVNNSLQHKRYLIVIDDIWRKDAWETINYALFKSNKDSKIITTTRVHDVAKACCSSDGDFVYKMKPLGSADSKKLFLERLFGSGDKCPENLKEVSSKILEKCGGLPLAIISISGLLANKQKTEDEWDGVHNSIGRELGKNPDAQSMMQILSPSYFDLPRQLKTCLLYISIFPEDSIIDKRRLIRRWTAEGFIQEEQGHTLYDLGERCFNELINRSLIQARRINIYGEVTACQVHDTILDFIVLKSEEENFVTIFGYGCQMLDQNSKVRRLSLHASSKEKVSMLPQLNLSHVRSVTVFDYYMELPLWSEFSLLRVLDLHDCRQVEDHPLTDIGNLFQLKYLSLRKTGVCELPEQIRKLQYLETLDLKKSKVTKLPASVAQLKRLVYLAIDKGVKLPDRTGSMRALEDLDCVDIFKQSIDFTRELGQLTNLRNVCLFLNSNNCSIAAEGSQYIEYMTNIASSLCKLDRLHSLSIDIDPECREDFSLDSAGGAPGGLRGFHITGNFISKVPNFVGSLVNLQLLTLCVKEFEVEDIMSLGRLPALMFLRLVAHESFQGRRIAISGTDGFQCLRHFDYRCAIPVTFEAGAMPKLKNLTLMFCLLKTSSLVSHEDFHFGIEHLSSLDSVHCLLHESIQAIVAWIAEKKTQMAHMSCKLVQAALAEMEATGREMGKETKCIDRAVRTHLKSSNLILRITKTWSIGNVKEEAAGSLLDEMGSLISLSRKALGLAHLLLVDVRGQVNERISNCPLKAQGSCQCKGLPEAKANLITSSITSE